MRVIRWSILLIGILLLAGCAQDAPIAPSQTAAGHGEVAFPGAGMCHPEGGEVDWGDGTKEMLSSLGSNTHTYADNGSYAVTIKCNNAVWPFGRSVTRANVNTAQPAKAFWGLSGAVLSGIAALITSIVGFLTFLIGRKTGKNSQQP